MRPSGRGRHRRPPRGAVRRWSPHCARPSRRQEEAAGQVADASELAELREAVARHEEAAAEIAELREPPAPRQVAELRDASPATTHRPDRVADRRRRAPRVARGPGRSAAAARRTPFRPRSPTFRRSLAELRAQFDEQELVGGQIAEQEHVEREIQSLVGDTQRQIAACTPASPCSATRAASRCRPRGAARRDELEALARRLDGVAPTTSWARCTPASTRAGERRAGRAPEPPRGPRPAQRRRRAARRLDVAHDSLAARIENLAGRDELDRLYERLDGLAARDELSELRGVSTRAGFAAATRSPSCVGLDAVAGRDEVSERPRLSPSCAIARGPRRRDELRSASPASLARRPRGCA